MQACNVLKGKDSATMRSMEAVRGSSKKYMEIWSEN